MTNFQPFQDDSHSVGIGDFTLENQGQQVNIYGNVTFTIDKQSLITAQQLHEAFGKIVEYLQQHGASDIDKSQIIAEQNANVSEIANPFL